MRGSSSGGTRTRRSVLRAGATALTLGLAGCADGRAKQRTEFGGTSSGEQSGYDTTSAPSVASVGFDVQDLVVRLTPEHRVTELSLIAPDGTFYTGATVAPGQTTVPIQVLDVDLLSGDYAHYEPGVHELVVVTETGRESVSIPMEPDLAVVDIRPVEHPESSIDYGKLVVIVENRGNAPSWVYDVVYADAPNFVANTPLGDNPGVFLMSGIESPDDLVVAAGEKGEFASGKAPLVFPDTSQPQCKSTKTRLTVKVGTATGDVFHNIIEVTASGSSRYTQVQDYHVCTDLSVRLVSGE